MYKIQASSEEERDEWIQVLHMASYECLKMQLQSLREQIQAKTGRDPITQPPPTDTGMEYETLAGRVQTGGTGRNPISPIFTKLSIQYAQNDQPVIHRGVDYKLRPASRVKWLWRHWKTRRNGNVARLDSSHFPTFTSEKYLFGTYRRKIINIYCPLMTEKSTNPRVKSTCQSLGKPWHGVS